MNFIFVLHISSENNFSESLFYRSVRGIKILKLFDFTDKMRHSLNKILGKRSNTSNSSRKGHKVHEESQFLMNSKLRKDLKTFETKIIF